MARLTDDAGEPCRLLKVADLRRAARDEEKPTLAALARRLRAGMKAESRRVTPQGCGLLLLFAVGVILLHGTTVMMLTMIGTQYPMLGLASFVGWIWLAVWVHRRIGGVKARRSAAVTAVSEGVCGGCAFSLEGVAADAGLVRCPECGARWSAERIVRPHWRDPVRPRPDGPWWVGLVPGAGSRADLWAPDGRGRFVPVPDMRLLRVDRTRAAALGPARLRTLRRACTRRRRWWRVLTMLPFVGIAVLTAHGAWLAAMDNEPVLAWVLGFVAGVAALAAVGTVLSSGYASARDRSRVLVAHGVCGSCLGELPAVRAVDGPAECAACGAAWAATDPMRPPTPGSPNPVPPPPATVPS